MLAHSILQSAGLPVVYFFLQSIQSINVMLALSILQSADPPVTYFVLQSIQSINVMLALAILQSASPPVADFVLQSVHAPATAFQPIDAPNPSPQVVGRFTFQDFPGG